VTELALVLSVVFFLIAFVLRSYVQWRRTGDHGFRLSRSAGVLPRVASVLMVFGFLVVFVALVGDAAGAFDRLSALDHAGLRAAGLAVMVLALLVTSKAQVDLRDSWRIGVDQGERTELVTDGTFRVVRNPIFTGMLAFGVGSALVAPSLIAIVGAALIVAGLEIQVRGVEEPYLLQTHGTNYISYAARVGRFLPRLGRT
jgi:protein-S-isoprenylcysteine O-methyltransferase Ste14